MTEPALTDAQLALFRMIFGEVVPSDASKNDRAKEICGHREANVVWIDDPAELGYHCPVCVYPLEEDGEFDERLHWSEYRYFLWCHECNVDYPSVLCQPDLAKATEIFLDILETDQQRDTIQRKIDSGWPNG